MIQCEGDWQRFENAANPLIFLGETRFCIFPTIPLDSPYFPIRVPAIFTIVLQDVQWHRCWTCNVSDGERAGEGENKYPSVLAGK